MKIESLKKDADGNLCAFDENDTLIGYASIIEDSESSIVSLPRRRASLLISCRNSNCRYNCAFSQCALNGAMLDSEGHCVYTQKGNDKDE